jgi:hypothetical protein|tara:strand:- start:462 stop:731 length:270 start_codon:yes stop_codon:yes gene_type:complete
MKIKPHVFADQNADAIAECTEGLSDLARRELWNVVVPRMEKLNAENFGSPGEYYSADPVTKYWDLLSEQAQRDINEALENQAKEWQLNT